MKYSPESLTACYDAVMAHYAAHARHDMPWRQPRTDGSFDSYALLVSEIMLQQTQVSRVTPKYETFMRRFPTLQSLARAPLGDVLIAWQGLGYNRRAKYLWQAAVQLVDSGVDQLPASRAELQALPGIGPNTAGALMAYGHNAPVVYVETNVRTVLIHHFFNDQQGVSDKALAEVLQQLLDECVEQPRQWYWALMDYGTYLKKTVGNLNKLSKGYTKQSRFEGSKRQIRGLVLRKLGTAPMTLNMLRDECADERLEAVLVELVSEHMIGLTDDDSYSLHATEVLAT